MKSVRTQLHQCDNDIIIHFLLSSETCKGKHQKEINNCNQPIPSKVAVATQSLEEAEKDVNKQSLEVQSCTKLLHEAEELRSLDINRPLTLDS